MQDPNADTEWNDVLRAKGIIPPKQKDELEITEEQLEKLVEETVKEKTTSGKTLEGLSLDELDELEDDEDEKVFLEYRQKRLLEMKEQAKLAKFGDIREISAEDYVQEVNKAGDGIWVVLHLYKQGIPVCTLINEYFQQLSKKFPATKFLKSVSTTCIPNYPDKNVPTLFVYFEGQMKKQFVGPEQCGGIKLKLEELEWMLHQTGAVKSDLEQDPRPKVKDVLFSSLRTGGDGNNSDDNDW